MLTTYRRATSEEYSCVRSKKNDYYNPSNLYFAAKLLLCCLRPCQATAAQSICLSGGPEQVQNSVSSNKINNTERQDRQFTVD